MLIPEVREDKNGRMTTRWVKQQWENSPSVNKGIPPVSLAAGNAERAKLFKTLNDGGRPREGLKDAIAAMVDNDTATGLNTLLQNQKGAQHYNDLSRRIIISIENPNVGQRLIQGIITHYERSRAAGHDYIVPYLVGLQSIDRELTEEQEWAVLQVTETVSEARLDLIDATDVEFPFEGYALRSKELIDYVIDHPELAESIGKAVVESTSDRVAVIEDVLSGSNHKAVLDGTL